MATIFHCIERLFNLMEVIENEIEFQPEEGKLNLNLEGAKTFKEKFKQVLRIAWFLKKS